MTMLAMGANTPIQNANFTLFVDLPAGQNIDVTALQLYADGEVRGDADMCFYNQTSIANGAVSLTISGTRQSFEFDLERIGADVGKIVVNATLDSGSFSSVGGLHVSSSEGHTLPIDTNGRAEAALILCEIYKRNGQWKIRNVSQGFNGGLQALAEHFGIEVAGPASDQAPQASPTPPPAPKPASPVNLSKVSLTKAENKISLEKADGKFGRIRVNLNWNQKKAGGLFGMGKRGIDLDLGAFVKFKQGGKSVIQALGRSFGALDEPPFVQLMGDDRSGTSADGEWLEINGDHWQHFKRVLIFAYIYEGVADWGQTDGVIRLMVPGQPEVEVRMNEIAGSSRETMCGVALLENQGDKIQVSREVRFFTDHSKMDRAYGWGMRWRAGSK